jgi:hypothetical protein
MSDYRESVECDSCGCSDFVVYSELGRLYVECDGCGASLFDAPAGVGNAT